MCHKADSFCTLCTFVQGFDHGACQTLQLSLSVQQALYDLPCITCMPCTRVSMPCLCQLAAQVMCMAHGAHGIRQHTYMKKESKKEICPDSQEAYALFLACTTSDLMSLKGTGVCFQTKCCWLALAWSSSQPSTLSFNTQLRLQPLYTCHTLGTHITHICHRLTLIRKHSQAFLVLILIRSPVRTSVSWESDTLRAYLCVHTA